MIWRVIVGDATFREQLGLLVLVGFFSGRFPMIPTPTTENGLEQGLPPTPVIEVERGEVSFEERLAQAILKRLDRVRSWRERLSPRFRRACSAGRLLFQVVGVAGYAGYFVSMHTLMRLVSGALVAGTWYAIYRIKEPTQPWN